MEAEPAKETSTMEAMLKVVSNRCRNLKKAIEKASALELAVQRGESLKAEQMESIKAKPGKQALLRELEEILRKQTALLPQASKAGEPAKLSRRAAKRLQREKQMAGANETSQATTESPTNEKNEDVSKSGDLSTGELKEDEPQSSKDPKQTEEKSLGESNNSVGAEEPRPPIEEGKPKESPVLPEQAVSGSEQISPAVVGAILEILHVIDYVKHQGGRESVLRYATSSPVIQNARRVSGLDIELLLYFCKMLTSPNGSVPHKKAVETSTEHCIKYLEGSESDAFVGTTYKTLADIVQAIATSPLLAQRNGDAKIDGATRTNQVTQSESGRDTGRQPRPKERSTKRSPDFVNRQRQRATPTREGFTKDSIQTPSSVVNDATAMGSGF